MQREKPGKKTERDKREGKREKISHCCSTEMSLGQDSKTSVPGLRGGPDRLYKGHYCLGFTPPPGSCAMTFPTLSRAMPWGPELDMAK